jgi:putative transcription factor
VIFLQCEVCGRQIFGAPFRAIIEGANLTVCSQCSKLGSGYWEPKREPLTQSARRTINRQPIRPYIKRKSGTSTMPDTLELVSNLGQMVRQARRDMGMSHEDLGRKIRERVSVLRKIESDKMIPDFVLAEKLEHALKIKLRVPPSEPKAQISSTNKPKGTTLGDLISFKLKQEEAEK